MASCAKPEIITDQSALAATCSRLAAAASFAFDTEFVGEEHYQPRVCLVQAATDSLCAIIDPLADVDLAPFWALVADSKVEVIVHAGLEDCAICWQQTGRPPANVFDLQVAAGFVGFGYPTSLTRLARVTVNAKIHKSQTLTDWGRRPLSAEQFRYAIDDVVHLPAICRVLRDRLAVLGRQAWSDEECRKLCDPASFAIAEVEKLQRLKGSSTLNAQELAIAQAILAERDKLAEDLDRPPRAVLRDHLVVEMARRGWTDIARLRSFRGLNLRRGALERVAAAIAHARQLPPDRWPEQTASSDSPEEEVLITLLSAVLRAYCDQNELSYALLTCKDDLRVFTRSRTRPERVHAAQPLTSGWRKEAVGTLLEGLISGRSALRVVTDGERHRLVLE